MSNNGTAMFDNNLGLSQYSDGDVVAVDIFDSAPLDNGYMSCRLYFGDQSRSVPARLVCGFFLQALSSTSWLRFAFGFYNPKLNPLTTIPTQISMPIIVYTYDPILFKKLNFNLVNAAVYVYNLPSILAPPNGYFDTTSHQLQYPNDQLIFGDAHTNQLLKDDAYVLRFNFPLRINGLCSKCCQPLNGPAYGDAYYHWNLRVIVCKVISGPVQPQVPPLTKATMMITGFYTPWYSLTDAERIVRAIATYHSTSTS
jgi:hypothetical protein